MNTDKPISAQLSINIMCKTENYGRKYGEHRIND